MRGYRSSTDNPICFLPDETYSSFPHAKYILTTRTGGADSWWRSMSEAVGWHFRRDIARYVFRFLIWPVRFLRRTDDKVQGLVQLTAQRYGAWDRNVYDRHNAHVQELIAKEQLLVYNISEGWEPLCRFLEVPMPNEPFPNLNERGAMQAIYFGMMAFGAFTWTMYLGGVAAAAYVATNPNVLMTAGRWSLNAARDLAAATEHFIHP